MKAHELLDDLERTVGARNRKDLVMSRHDAVARVASRAGDANAPLLVVMAGLHGDERAGPITIARHLDEIVDHAHARGLAVVIYPLANPTGFDAGTRYNADGDRGDVGNNDFIRYRELNEQWEWSTGGPAETRILRDVFLRNEPLQRIVAAIDLHQDCITPNVGAASYAYAFPPLAVYAPIVRQVRELVPILANSAIDAGYADAARSDENGLLVRHDGSFSDAMIRVGARHSIAVETTGATPLDVACAVNVAWIRGVIELI